MKIFKNVVHADGTIERFEPYTYACGNYMRGNSTKSSDPMIAEPNLPSLGAWIDNRKVQGLPGGVRMKSKRTGKAGLHSIAKIEVQ